MLLILIQFRSVLLFCSNLVSLSLEKCCHNSLYVETAKVSVPLAGTHKHYWLTGSVCHRDSSTYLQRNAWENEGKYIAEINIIITILILAFMIHYTIHDVLRWLLFAGIDVFGINFLWIVPKNAKFCIYPLALTYVHDCALAV